MPSSDVPTVNRRTHFSATMAVCPGSKVILCVLHCLIPSFQVAALQRSSPVDGPARPTTSPLRWHLPFAASQERERGTGRGPLKEFILHSKNRCLIPFPSAGGCSTSGKPTAVRGRERAAQPSASFPGRFAGPAPGDAASETWLGSDRRWLAFRN